MYPYHNRSNFEKKQTAENTLENQVHSSENGRGHTKPQPLPQPMPKPDHRPQPLPQPMPKPDHRPQPLPQPLPKPDHRPQPLPQPMPKPDHRPEPPKHGSRPIQAPPTMVPPKGNVLRVDPGSIRGCMFSFTYVWLKSGREFWFYPVYLGRSSIAGFRWSRSGWSYFGFDLDSIEAFSCNSW